MAKLLGVLVALSLLGFACGNEDYPAEDFAVAESAEPAETVDVPLGIPEEWLDDYPAEHILTDRLIVARKTLGLEKRHETRLDITAYVVDLYPSYSCHPETELAGVTQIDDYRVLDFIVICPTSSPELIEFLIEATGDPNVGRQVTAAYEAAKGCCDFK
jgi:hypothetical protein